MTDSRQDNMFGQKVVRYTRLLSRWIKSGGSMCGHCGYRVNTSAVTLLNNVAMAFFPLFFA